MTIKGVDKTGRMEYDFRNNTYGQNKNPDKLDGFAAFVKNKFKTALFKPELQIH